MIKRGIIFQAPKKMDYAEIAQKLGISLAPTGFFDTKFISKVGEISIDGRFSIFPEHQDLIEKAKKFAKEIKRE